MSATLHLPEYIVSGKSIDVRIGALAFELQGFDYPEYQREKVWSYPMKRNLIDSIQRKFPIPPNLRSQERTSTLDS